MATWRNWLHGLRKVGFPGIPPTPTPRPRCRPRLEVLEDRLAPAAFMVTTNADDGSVGTLRWAIQQSNASPPSSGANIIQFGIPDHQDVQTITVNNALGPFDPITSPVMISGWSQWISQPLAPDGDGDFGINLSYGVNINGNGVAGDGLTVEAADCIIDSLAIYNFNGDGIAVENTAPDTTVEDCDIGTDLSATTTQSGNAGVGINVVGPNAVIRGDTISRNGRSGVLLNGTTGAQLTFNYIGTDPCGTEAMPNGLAGVFLMGGANNNSIGVANGLSSGQQNVISGNNSAGIWMLGASNNTITNNLIGTDITGLVPVRNIGGGIWITAWDADSRFPASSGNTIIGNVVSGNGGADSTGTGNTGDGITLSGGALNGPLRVDGDLMEVNGNQNVSGTVIQDNYIGVGLDGVTKIPNAQNGISINGAPDTMVGGVPSQGNVISGNGWYGVDMTNSAFGTWVLGNYIGTDAQGESAVANGADGVAIESGSGADFIGHQGGGNVISGNGGNGVSIHGSGSNSNIVQSNYIGTDVSGAFAIANAANGVLIDIQSSSNTIGGPAAADGNVISGNSLDGVNIRSGTYNSVDWNYIGTDVSGTVKVPNRYCSVELNGSYSSVSNNVISGNGVNNNTYYAGTGILVWSSYNQISANYIGTTADGGAALGNYGDGVDLVGSYNTLGGAAAGNGNVISGNGHTTGGNGYGYGVEVAGNNNVIQDNIIGLDATEQIILANAGGRWLQGGGPNNQYIGNTTN
jgi:hypothetical protein